VRWACL